MTYYKNQLIINEYNEQKEDFTKLGEIAMEMIRKKLHESSIPILAIEHRIKEEKSLAGKLELKGDKYDSLADITDILGIRLICYFSDDVDKLAQLVREIFYVDEERSIDKRKILDPQSFGYLSLHYICTLPDNGKYSKKLSSKKFEIQIRTVLQHAWSSIDHDLSYKTEFGIPQNVVRDFSRVAGLLELADKEFVAIRDNVKHYSEDVYKRIKDDDADDVPLDMVSLLIYTKNNPNMIKVVEKIQEGLNVTINKQAGANYMPQFKYFNVSNIAELNEFVNRNSELAIKVAIASMQGQGITELPADVGLRFLCVGELINKNYSVSKITEYFKISLKSEEKAFQQAGRLLLLKEKLGL